MIKNKNIILNMYKDLISITILHFIYLNFNKYQNLISSFKSKSFSIFLIYLIFHYISLLISYKIFIINKKYSVREALYFGFLIYSFLNFVNFIIFNNLSFKLFILDSLWGGLLYALTLYLNRIIFDKKIKIN